MKRNLSTDYIYYYIPKTNNNITTINSPITSQDTFPFKHIKKPKLTFSGLKGSSTFDYLNNINQASPKLPNISNSFLTKNLRNKNSMKNIERENMLKTISINPNNKLRLSNNCELFYILNKTLMNDKNSLKQINNKELLGLNISPEEINTEKKDQFYLNTRTKFKNFYIKKSLSNDGKYNNNIYNTNTLLFKNNSAKNNDIDNNINNKNEGMSKYYINFLYNQIFPKFFFERHDKYNVVDNKLNIYYAENDAQFRENLIKKNKKLRARGKKEKKLIINRDYVSNKLLEIKRKIGFVKGVSDYSIPSIILQKVKYNSKQLQLRKGKKKEFLLPFEEIEKEVNRVDQLKTKILSETLSINNVNNQN